MNMKAFLTLTQSTREIEILVVKALAAEINKSLSKKVAAIIHPVKEVVKAAISSSPEIASLSSGSLRFDFGIPQGDDVVSQIVDAVSDNVFVEASPVKAVGAKLTGNILIHIQSRDFQNLLSLPSGFTTTEKGESLPWLRWLLEAGDEIIIANFGVRYGPGRGRSGGATMSPKLRPFKVDTSFSGTEDNNFITRALERNMAAIVNVIEKGLK